MRIVVDLSETASFHQALPAPTIITDDGDIVFSFEDLEVRMNYMQFEDLFRGMAAFRRARPPKHSLVIYDD